MWRWVKEWYHRETELFVIVPCLLILVLAVTAVIVSALDEAHPATAGWVIEKTHHDAHTTRVCLSQSDYVCTMWSERHHPERWELIIREDAGGGTDGVYVSKAKWDATQIGDRWDPPQEPGPNVPD